jgi:hypothetical protein
MKKKSVFTLTLLFLLGVVFVIPAKPASLQTSMIPDNARWVIHFDVEKFTSTRFCDLLKQDEAIGLEKKTLGISKMFKFDPFKDIMGITVFGTGKGEKNTVVCLSGNFNKDHLLILLDMNVDHRKIPYGKYTIHKWDRSQFGTFATDHLMVIASNEGVLKNVLDVISGKKNNIGASNLMPHLKGIPKDAFLKAVIDNISHLIGADDASKILKKTGMVFFIAMERSENLTMKLKLTTDSPETAKNIQQIVTGFLALARLKQNQGEIDPKLKFLDDLKVRLERNIVYMELSHPSKDLVKMFSHGKGHFDIFD